MLTRLTDFNASDSESSAEQRAVSSAAWPQTHATLSAVQCNVFTAADWLRVRRQALATTMGTTASDLF